MLVPMGSSGDSSLRGSRQRPLCPLGRQDAIQQKKPPQGASSNSRGRRRRQPLTPTLSERASLVSPPRRAGRGRRKAQCASAQTFLLVKYISPAKMIRNTNTCRPSRLRSSICGSAAHIRNVETSCAYCATVAGEPSSNVTWPSLSGGGILMARAGEYLL